MSYCRWSSDGFQSDLYLYESDEGGWRAHVANKKIIGEVPPIAHLDYNEEGVFDPTSEEIDALTKSYVIQREFLETAEYKRIGLPLDGQSFFFHDLEDVQDWLKRFKKMGYCYPSYVDKMIQNEIEEEDINGSD